MIDAEYEPSLRSVLALILQNFVRKLFSLCAKKLESDFHIVLGLSLNETFPFQGFFWKSITTLEDSDSFISKGGVCSWL